MMRRGKVIPMPLENLIKQVDAQVPLAAPSSLLPELTLTELNELLPPSNPPPAFPAPSLASHPSLGNDYLRVQKARSDDRPTNDGGGGGGEQKAR